MEEITYTLRCITFENHDFQMGKELRSPKLIMSALKKTAYPPDFKGFKKVYFVKHTKTVISEISDIDYIDLM